MSFLHRMNRCFSPLPPIATPISPLPSKGPSTDDLNGVRFGGVVQVGLWLGIFNLLDISGSKLLALALILVMLNKRAANMIYMFHRYMDNSLLLNMGVFIKVSLVIILNQKALESSIVF